MGSIVLVVTLGLAVPTATPAPRSTPVEDASDAYVAAVVGGLGLGLVIGGGMSAVGGIGGTLAAYVVTQSPLSLAALGGVALAVAQIAVGAILLYIGNGIFTDAWVNSMSSRAPSQTSSIPSRRDIDLSDEEIDRARRKERPRSEKEEWADTDRKRREKDPRRKIAGED